MKFALLALMALTLFMPISGVSADDQEDAASAVEDILASLKERKFETLWDRQMSDVFKSQLTRDSFLTNMKIGRQPLGLMTKSKFLDMVYTQNDPMSGVQGEIYQFSYLNTYAIGRFHERITVMKEGDGKFRLVGFRGSPATSE